MEGRRHLQSSEEETGRGEGGTKKRKKWQITVISIYRGSGKRGEGEKEAPAVQTIFLAMSKCFFEGQETSAVPSLVLGQGGGHKRKEGGIGKEAYLLGPGS